MLPTIRLGEHEVTRLIVGGNPFSGNSHIDAALDEEMRDFFTTETIKNTLRHCEECGINTYQLRADRHIMRILREYRQQGGKLQWIAQTAPEFASFESNVNQIVQMGAIAIYFHGSTVDKLFRAGNYAEIERCLKILRDTGKVVGLATHMPEVIRYSEEHGWDVDFYMACVYNISKVERDVPYGREPFFESDIPLMYEAIRSTPKPCLAFKILGASRRCATQETVKAAFEEAYREIKPIDGVIVGVYPKNLDQVALNCSYAEEGIRKAAQK